MFRKILTTIAAAMLTATVLLADDIITVDADIIRCKVTEISDQLIKYRKPGESFDREIHPSKVFKIKYANGEEDKVEHKEQVPVAPAGTAQAGRTISNAVPLISTPTDYSDLQPAEKIYNIGDWFSENGLEGVVVEVTPDGRHGKIVHPNKFGYFLLNHGFATYTGPKRVQVGMNDKTNGYNNYLKLLQFVDQYSDVTLADFPMQNEISKSGEGWYVPSVEEAQALLNLKKQKVQNYKGEVAKLKGKNTNLLKIVNENLKKHNADQIRANYVIMTSTEFWSYGGKSSSYHTLFGDPDQPQFVVYKVVGYNDGKAVELCRDFRDYGTRAFHRF